MRHLGKTTEYTNQYDPSLLERIDRAPRREGYVPMQGFDVWTAYEFSFLLPSGLPTYYVIRISSGCNNPYIFESKSLKLYLNSFNNHVFNSLEHALNTIRQDLSQCAGGQVIVKEVNSFPHEGEMYNNIRPAYYLSSTPITDYEYNPGLLESITLPSQKSNHQAFYTDLLRSNCEITNQPDFGRCTIILRSKGKALDVASFLRYIVSYRNHQEFHEPTCERIYQDLYRLLLPENLTVVCQYTRRGGIDINPIRCTDDIHANLPKLLQQ